MLNTSETAEMMGEKKTRMIIFFNLPSRIECPSCRDDCKFLHILQPAIVYPAQISVPQMKIATYEAKYQNAQSEYKTSRLNVSVSEDTEAVMPSNTQMF